MTERIALVTGAGRGIGRASALALAAEGCRVAVTARTASELDEVCAEITGGGGVALAIQADLSRPAAPGEIVEAVQRAWGPVEILVNNAGIGSSAKPLPLVDFDDDFWELTMAVNVTAPYRLTRLVLPPMLRAGWGRIVNIASINSRIPSLHGAAYITSKHALAGLTKATALEVGGQGITCNAVCPGATATRTNDKRLEYDAQRLGKSVEELSAAASPLGRRILPDEVAVAVAFLAGEPANAINGQLLNVCGGTLMV
jgi:NAD(P)-dependent dehydrogenase (short-subunit alcohol dehydrogenase family)